MKKMRLFQALILIAVILAGAYVLIQLDKGRITAKLDPRMAEAVTKYSEVIPGIQTMPIGFSRIVTTTLSGGTAIHTFYAPFKMEILGL